MIELRMTGASTGEATGRRRRMRSTGPVLGTAAAALAVLAGCTSGASVEGAAGGPTRSPLGTATAGTATARPAPSGPTSSGPSSSAPTSSGSPTAPSSPTGSAEPSVRADVWKGFEFTDLVDHAERYPDGEVKPLARIAEVLPTVCGRRVPVLPAGSPQTGANYDYPEAGTQRGVVAFPSDARAKAALRTLRSALAACSGRDGSGDRKVPVTWRSRADRAGDEAVAVSAVSVRTIGGEGGPPPYHAVEHVLVVRVGSVVWVGRTRDVSLSKQHFPPESHDGLRRGFAAVAGELRERG